MKPILSAGFECARLRQGQPDEHDLMVSSRNFWPTETDVNLAATRALGFRSFRDTARGMPSRRTAFRPSARMTWDVFHFDWPVTPSALRAYVEGLYHDPFDLSTLIPVVEPSSVDLHGRSKAEAVALAVHVAALLAIVRPMLSTCDPFHGAGDHEFEATDALIATGMFRQVGVNYHPQYGVRPLREMLARVAERYPEQKVAITETSLHLSRADRAPLYPHVDSTKAWMETVAEEIEASGVPVTEVIYYPVLPMPPWHMTTLQAMDSAERWDSGWPCDLHLDDLPAYRSA